MDTVESSLNNLRCGKNGKNIPENQEENGLEKGTHTVTHLICKATASGLKEMWNPRLKRIFDAL